MVLSASALALGSVGRQSCQLVWVDLISIKLYSLTA